MEWAIEEGKKTGLPVAATMCIGPEGDLHGVSTGDCAVRMAKAGKYRAKLGFSISLLVIKYDIVFCKFSMTNR